MKEQWLLSALIICFVSGSEDEFCLKSQISRPRGMSAKFDLSYLLTSSIKNLRYKYKILNNCSGHHDVLICDWIYKYHRLTNMACAKEFGISSMPSISSFLKNICQKQKYVKSV